MSEYVPETSPEDAAMYKRYELTSDSLVSAFDWAMNQPDTIEYGEWSGLDEETQEQVTIELVSELYTYGCAELGFPTDFVDDCFSEANNE